MKPSKGYFALPLPRQYSVKDSWRSWLVILFQSYSSYTSRTSHKWKHCVIDLVSIVQLRYHSRQFVCRGSCMQLPVDGRATWNLSWCITSSGHVASNASCSEQHTHWVLIHDGRMYAMGLYSAICALRSQWLMLTCNWVGEHRMNV